MNAYKASHLVRCRSCGFVFSSQAASAADLETYYARYPRITALPDITVKRYNELLSSFEKYRHTNRLIDLGCGNGLFLEQAKKRGWDVWGTEISESSLEECRAKGIHAVKPEDASMLSRDRSFDVVTSLEVIEHLPNPKQEAKLIASLLRSGGVLYLTTPNFNSLSRLFLRSKWNVIGYPEHLCYFTPRTIVKLLNKHGLESKNITTTGISPYRFRRSFSDAGYGGIPGNTGDEELRRNAEEKFFYRALKNTVNTALSFSGTGDTIKATFVKR